MLDWIFGSDNESEGTENQEEEEEQSHPEYLEDDWPYLMVGLNDGDRVELQLQQNHVSYRGPEIDSIITYCPATCNLVFFETIEELRKAVYVVWESDVSVQAVYLGKDGGVLNKDTEIYDFMDKTQKVEIV